MKKKPRLAAILAALLAVCSSTPGVEAATVTAMRLDPSPIGGATLTLTFSGGVPTYHVTGAGTADVNIVLDGTTFASQLAPVLPGAGDVTTATVATTGSTSSVTLHLAGTAPVRVRPQGTSLVVDVSPISGSTTPNPFGPPPSATGFGPVTEVVFLKYADISEVAGVLSATSNIASNDNFTPQQSNIGGNSLSGTFGGVNGTYVPPQQQPQIYGGAFGQVQGVAQRVNDNIAVDRRLNAIVLSGTADVVAQLKEMIEKVDVPVPSVLLETQVIELDETAARDVGFNFSPSGSGVVADASGGTGGITGGGYLVRTLSPGTGQFSAQATLSAQISNGNAKVIAKPRILAMSGQQASILTGDAIPIITTVVTTGSNGSVAQQVNYVNVGVNLQILPRVSNDGYVTSHIYSEVSSVTSFTQGIPEISQRNVSTQATVRDGEAFIIGGLLQDNEIKNLVKLPFVGDIPLIGVFFRHATTSHTQTNLYLVVTPHVIHAANVPEGALGPPPAGQRSAVPLPSMPPAAFLTPMPYYTPPPTPVPSAYPSTYHLSTVPTPTPSPTPAR